MKEEAERTDTNRDEAVQIQNTQEGQPGDILASVDTLKVMEGIKDDCGEMNKEQENVKEQVYHIDNKEESLTKPANFLTIIEWEIEQLTTTEVARNIWKTETEPQERDTPVEEHEEGMLLEDGVLLTYVFKKSKEDVEIKAVDSPTKPETKATDSIVDIPMSNDSHKISKNLQKSC